MDPITAFIVNLVVGVVLSVASTLIQQAFAQDKKQKVAGVRGSIQTGGDNPLAFMMGFYGTAGQLEYAGTWGNSGETPNAYFTKVISLSDIPVNDITGMFVNGEKVTINATADGDKGFPIDEYTTGSTKHLWVKFYTGTQTTRDALLGTAFGTDADRPWNTTHVGRGVAYAVVTALVNRELFAGLPEYLFEVEGIKLYDPRLDTTAGGSGSHRLATPSTWEYSDNPVVAIYNILCGIYYDGTDWMWGPQNIAQARLPYANWSAEMDKCDALVSLAAGGTQKRFRFGLEVSVDQEPHAVIGELLKACEGRIAEIGGLYKILVGEPGSSVKSITDEDMVITEGQSFEPFPGLESTYNGITATYPEPLEAWESKEAPARYDTALKTEDDGRRLPFSTDFKAVPYALQVQRIMLASLNETRRFRRHSATMPAEWWEYEPLDVFDWTSDRNGYTAKEFLITVMDDLPNGNQIVGSQEIDPTDFSGWTTADELTYDTSPLVVSRPAPQITTGFSAAPYTVTDDGSTSRRPAIEVFWDGGLHDVRSITIEVRESWGGNDVIAVVTVEYDIAVASPSVVIANPAILPDKTYEVRGLYLPFSGRITRWSNQDVDGVDGAWATVTTPNIKLGADDIDVTYAALAASVQELLEWNGRLVRDMRTRLQQYGSLMSEQDLANFYDKKILRRELLSKTAEITAGYIEAIEVATGGASGIATKLETLFAALGGNTAEVNVLWEASAGPTGYSVQYGVTLAVDDGIYRSAGFYGQVPDNTALPTRWVFDADQFVITTDGGATVSAMFDSAGAMIRDLKTGTITGPGGTSYWNLTTGAFRVST